MPDEEKVTSRTRSHRMSPAQPRLPAEPLRRRARSFLAAIGAALAAAAGGGLVWGAVTELPVAEAIGYSVLILGTLVLAGGGASGGGFVKQLDPDPVFSLHTGPDTGRGVADPIEGTGIAAQGMLHGREPNIEFLKLRLANELRPRRNPEAFWTVIGGAGMMAVGLAILQIA
jgi:hypothetical protein